MLLKSLSKNFLLSTVSFQHPQGGLTFPSYELCSGKGGCKLAYFLLDRAEYQVCDKCESLTAAMQRRGPRSPHPCQLHSGKEEVRDKDEIIL